MGTPVEVKERTRHIQKGSVEVASVDLAPGVWARSNNTGVSRRIPRTALDRLAGIPQRRKMVVAKGKGEFRDRDMVQIGALEQAVRRRFVDVFVDTRFIRTPVQVIDVYVSPGKTVEEFALNKPRGIWTPIESIGKVSPERRKAVGTVLRQTSLLRHEGRI